MAPKITDENEKAEAPQISGIYPPTNDPTSKPTFIAVFLSIFIV